ncbi:MAG TPA: ABC transporter permease [Candidatus Acidoferrum sp.]|nr:ABC transporter permease [Candidatus Acidoferrum sp.]
MTRRPGLSLALFFTIALGIASTVSVRGFVDGLTKPSFPLGSLNRLVSVFGRDAQREADPLSKQQYLYARSRHDIFQWVGAAHISPGTITMGGQTASVSVAAVSPKLAEVFGLPLDEGVVISHRMWQREFGASVDVLGEEIRINSVTARVTGIAPDWLEGIYRDRPVDVWMPLPEEKLQQLDDSSRNLWVVARLDRDISPSQAKAVAQPGDRVGELRVLPYTGLTPERAAHLSRIGTLLDFAAGGVFFIACVNVGLFLLGRASARFHDTAVRVAFGASRGQLARELLSDSVVISVAGGALGMLLAVWTSYLIPALLHSQDAERLTFAPALFGIAKTSLVFVGIMILCGLLPVMVTPLDRPKSVIQQDSTGISPAIRRLRLGLVTAQMASCCVLVISTAFLVDGLRTAVVTNAGQRLGHTVFATAQANPVVAIEYFQRAEEAAKLIRGVSGVAWAGTLPGGQPMWQSFRIEPAQLPLREVTLDADWITSDSLTLLDLPPKAGHMFGAAERTCRAAIVNEEAAEELFGRYTTGRTLRAPEIRGPAEIIGVVAMRELEKVAKKNQPTVYFDYTGHQDPPPQRITDVRFRVPVSSELASADFETNVVSPGYFDAVGSTLVAGQGFGDHTESTGCRIGIVNQEAADLYFGGNAVRAAVIDEQGRRTDIIGVVHSGPLGAFQRRVEPTLYLPISQDVLTSMSMIVHVRGVDGALLAHLRRRLEEVPGRGPNPVLVRTFEAYLNQTSLAPLRIAALLLGVSATIALLLSVLGLFGALSDAARQRRCELAIRIAVGAPRWRVIGQVLGEGVRLAGAGMLAGMLVSIAFSRWMSGITPGSGSPPLWVWLSAPLALAGVVTVASALPARRALMTNPLMIMHDA